MTNFPNGITTTTVNTTGDAGIGGALAVTGVVTGASASVTNAVTAGSAAVTGLTNTGTLKVGGGDTINSIVTYTSANTNIAAINIAATVYAELNVTVTGITNTDTIMAVKMDRASQVAENIQVLGAFVSAANTVRVQLYAAANTNALSGKTFAITVKR